MRARKLSTEEVAQLERTLRWHFPRLHREMLEGPDAFPDAYLAIAGHLRVLLCDHKYPPVLLEYAKARGMELVVHAPPIPISNKKTTTLVAWSALIASWEPVPDFQFVAVDAEHYLDSPIGVVQFDVASPSKAYTPRQIINWVANTEGVSHFNFHDTKDPVHRHLQTPFGERRADAHNSELEKILRQLGLWTLHAIDHVVPSDPPLMFSRPTKCA